MGFWETLKAEWRVITGAPFSLGGIVIAAVAGTLWAADAFVYKPVELQNDFLAIQLEVSRLEADTAKAELKAMQTNGGVNAGSVAITATRPAYLSTMDNDDLRQAAYTLVNQVGDFVLDYGAKDEAIRRNRKLPPEERAKRSIALAEEFAEKFRANFALNAVNMITELSERAGEKSYELQKFNDGPLDYDAAYYLAVEIKQFAKRLP